MNSKGLSGVPAKNTRGESDGTPVPVPDARGNEPRLYDQGLPGRKISGRSNPRREQAILKDSLYILRRDDTYHIVSENYSYKTETYYSILSRELEGKKVRPSSRAVLDAYVVPICLERAKQGGIPVCEWGISQGYVPLPSVLYGLNYFATTSDYFVVHDNGKAKEVIKHITNIGKYPFCYQKLDDGAALHSCVGIFGKARGACSAMSRLAEMVYECFSIPLVTMVFVKSGGEYRLSSLAPTRYSQLIPDERTLLAAYLSHQEFL